MNVNKLYLLNKRQWRENYKVYRIAVFAIAGILSFLFLITWHWRDSFSGDVNRGVFLIGLFGGGCLFGSSLLKDLSRPSRGMWLMGIPASAHEKLFIVILYATLFYLLTFLSLFYITEGFFSWLVKEPGMPVKHTDLLHNKFYNFLFTFINFQLLILLGSVSFKRGSLLITILLIIIIFSLSYNANNYLLMLMTGEKSIDGSWLFSYFQFRHGGENVYVYLPTDIQAIVTVFFNYCFPIILYFIIYLKFRETEL